jgi:hypothetical protein
MDNLPSWVLWIMTGAVGVNPGLAILPVRPIARLLHRVLWPRPEVAPQPASTGAPKAVQGRGSARVTRVEREILRGEVCHRLLTPQ